MNELERRREARRLKILQNSENRLSRISSVEHKTCWGSNVESVPEETIPELPAQRLDNYENKQNSLPVREKIAPNPIQKSHRCVTIFGLAVFMHLLRLFLDGFLQLNMNETFSNMLFLPVFLFEVSEVIGGRPKSSNIYLEYLLVFAAGNKTFARTAAQYLGLISGVLQDVMVYFFCHVWCHIAEKLVLAMLQLR